MKVLETQLLTEGDILHTPSGDVTIKKIFKHPITPNTWVIETTDGDYLNATNETEHLTTTQPE
jgi:hypothetical protein